MQLSFIGSKTGVTGVVLAMGMVLAPVLVAQQTDKTAQPSGQTQTAKPETPALPSSSDLTKTPVEPPKVNPQEEADYKTFFDTKPEAMDTQIQLGQKFLGNYPTSKYTEVVSGRMAMDFYAKQQWKDFFDFADKTLSLNPDNVDILVLDGWVIPHSWDPNDLGASQKLDTAESHEKRALQILQTLQKRPDLTDAQFAAAKGLYLSQAHSGLGLVYFRRQDYADSATELQQATTGSASADSADYFVMGIDLTQLKRFTEAADAFDKCGQIAGPLQDRCKQLSDQAKKQAAAAPAPPAAPTPQK